MTSKLTSLCFSLLMSSSLLWALSIVKLFDYKTYDIYMNTSRKLCKIWLCHNLELEIFKYHWNFERWSKTPYTFNIYRKLHENWGKLYEFINLNARLLEFSTIFVMEKVKHLFLHCYKNPTISYFNPPNIYIKGMVFFQILFTS